MVTANGVYAQNSYGYRTTLIRHNERHRRKVMFISLHLNGHTKTSSTDSKVETMLKVLNTPVSMEQWRIEYFS